jgi:hypothetical protein
MMTLPALRCSFAALLLLAALSTVFPFLVVVAILLGVFVLDVVPV